MIARSRDPQDLAIAHDNGNLLLGLRDRQSDVLPHFVVEVSFDLYDAKLAFGLGDIVRATPDGDAWSIDPREDFYDDRQVRFADESGHGGLAHVVGSDTTVAGAHVRWRDTVQEGVFWYDDVLGKRVQSELLCDPESIESYDSVLVSAPAVLADDELPGRYYRRAPGTVGDVEVLCRELVKPTPTATAVPSTPTPTPTAAPSPSPTMVSSETPSPTPTAPGTQTATAELVPVLLPVALREKCTPEKQRTDAVLVIDASLSMLELTHAGRTKLAAAKQAAGIFLDHLDFGGGDQAAVVAFNAVSSLQQTLTGDRNALDAALAGIESAEYTRIHLAIEMAASELDSERRRHQNLPVMIVLTDGRANPDPVSLAIAQAESAKVAGVVVYTIGLGNDLDDDALREMAHGPDHFHHAPSAEKLADIYRQIAVEIPCPKDAFWGRR